MMKIISLRKSFSENVTAMSSNMPSHASAHTHSFLFLCSVFSCSRHSCLISYRRESNKGTSNIGAVIRSLLYLLFVFSNPLLFIFLSFPSANRYRTHRLFSSAVFFFYCEFTSYEFINRRTSSIDSKI